MHHLNIPHRLAVALAFILVATIAVPAVAGGPGGKTITLTPADDIQNAINSGMYSEIVLSPGTYNQGVDFGGQPITLRGTNPDDATVVSATILDGTGLGGSIIVCDNGEGPDTRIVGLTIMNGLATGTSPNDRGGAIRCFPGSPTIDRCRVFNNAATFGGALYASGSTPRIIDCLFVFNDAGEGGCLYFNMSGNQEVEVTGTTFDTCSGSRGGVIRSQSGRLRLIDCLILDAFAGIVGGAIYSNNTVLEIERTMINGCSAPNGSAIYIENEPQLSTMSNSVLRFNGDFDGSVVYADAPFDFRNVTMRQNFGVAGPDNAVIFATDPQALTLNSTIIWDNELPAFTGEGSFIVSYSLIEGGWPGDGNIDVDPQFTGQAGLSPTSPAIDAGDSIGFIDPNPIDFDGNPRAANRAETPDTGRAYFGLTVDMGATEFQPAPIGNPNCPADVDLSGAVDFNDLLSVLSAFGACP
ncbi:MAG: choice-of-anchor Q domain-containing protein [Phycisphaerales bacterium]